MRLPAKLRSGYFFILALTNQYNAVADLRFGTISHIYNSLIHGDATKNRASLSVNEDMTTVTKLQWHAVGVASGNGATSTAAGRRREGYAVAAGSG